MVLVIRMVVNAVVGDSFVMAMMMARVGRDVVKVAGEHSVRGACPVIANLTLAIYPYTGWGARLRAFGLETNFLSR